MGRVTGGMNEILRYGWCKFPGVPVPATAARALSKRCGKAGDGRWRSHPWSRENRVRYSSTVQVELLPTPGCLNTCNVTAVSRVFLLLKYGTIPYSSIFLFPQLLLT